MDFSEYEGRGEDSAVLRKVTDEVMDELTRIVQDMRKDYPPRWA
jgi:hypothetical protein